MARMIVKLIEKSFSTVRCDQTLMKIRGIGSKQNVCVSAYSVKKYLKNALKQSRGSSLGKIIRSKF